MSARLAVGAASVPLFTVFTPTYNRAHTLPDVYQSLCAQTLKDFEWLIVDDGSLDETRDLVERWQRCSDFAVRYLHQENRGKHAAFNVGVAQAAGTFFLPWDSDDTCVPQALERFREAWFEIPEPERYSYSGVSCLCMDKFGRVVGSRFSEQARREPDAAHSAAQWAGGERWGFHRTSVLREFPFPEFEGERWIPEGIVWLRIAHKYRIRFINEPLRIYEQLDDGLMAAGIGLRVRNPRGSAAYYWQLARSDMPLITRIAAAANFARFSLHAQQSISEVLRNSPLGTLNLLSLPIAVVAYLNDRRLMAPLRTGR